MSTDDPHPGRDVPLLEVRGLVKRYGPTTALDGVTFQVRAGECLALLGRNGAGKSTLIKILAGVQRADAGTVLVDGRETDARDRDDELAFIHQDLGLIDQLTVAENVAFVRGYPRRRGLIAWRELRQQSAELLARWDIDVSPSSVVGALDPVSRAMVAIARALAADARCVVLDEPTASLPEHDVDQLLDAVGRVKRRGVGIIYVTHRLAEIARVAERFVVLQNGRIAHEGLVKETPRQKLIEYVVGADQTTARPGRSTPGPVVLEVRDLTSASCNDVHFTVHSGEVVALTGLAGAGQSEVARVLAGAARLVRGTVRLNGQRYEPVDVPAAQRAGVVLLPGDRVREASIAAFDCTVNFHLRRRGTRALLHPRRERALADAMMDEWGVVPAQPAAALSALSGGNQQKLLVAKWMATDPSLLIAEEPTAGVDVGARASIHQRLRAAAAAGAAILLVSSDSEEVAELGDRAVVFRQGSVACELTAPMTDSSIAAAMHESETRVTTA